MRIKVAGAYDSAADHDVDAAAVMRAAPAADTADLDAADLGDCAIGGPVTVYRVNPADLAAWLATH